jgi:NhaP-type Na+/H+ or K+/H+ antiporter
LILYRFAVVAISTGMFSLPKAAGTFVVIVAGEMIFGAAVGWLSLRARQRACDPQIEITLSLITPYVAFWIPQHFGGSGVIATVACGLYISWNGPLLISSATRLQGIFFWDLVIYLIEGLLFLLTGFEIRSLFEKSKAFPLNDVLFAIALVAVIVVVARFAWVYPAIYLPRLSKRVRDRDPSPPWQRPFAIAFTGVRGAVSLAAALALPASVPDRDLIVFLTYAVIAATLLVQGLSLPGLIRALRIEDDGKDSYRENKARLMAARAAMSRVDLLREEEWVRDETAERVRALYEYRQRRFASRFAEDGTESEQIEHRSVNYQRLMHEIFSAQREAIVAMRNEGRITDEIMHRVERDLDLEESRLEV